MSELFCSIVPVEERLVNGLGLRLNRKAAKIKAMDMVDPDNIKMVELTPAIGHHPFFFPYAALNGQWYKVILPSDSSLTR